MQEDAGLGALLAPGCREAAKEPGSLCGQLLLTAPSGRAAGGAGAARLLPGPLRPRCVLGVWHSGVQGLVSRSQPPAVLPGLFFFFFGGGSGSCCCHCWGQVVSSWGAP